MYVPDEMEDFSMESSGIVDKETVVEEMIGE